MSQPNIVITTYIASTPEKVWAALTNPEITRQYWFDTRIESDWKPGSKILYRRDGKITDEHTILQIEAPRLLRHTFHPTFAPFDSESPSQVEFQIAASGPVVRLVVTHDHFAPGSKVHGACSQGWPMILGSLKTLLETGSPLPPFTFAPPTS